MTPSNEFPKTKEVRDLYWILKGPGLLNPDFPAFQDKLLKDEWFQEKAEAGREWFKNCDANPNALLDDLNNRENQTALLGRYFEALLSFWIREYLKPETFFDGIAVHEHEISRPGQGRNTIGEFDFLFRLPSQSGAPSAAVHWEASVKFYIFCGDTIDQAKQMNHYFGTFLRDRLDIKVGKIFNHQLKLGETPDGQCHLAHLGLSNPQVKAWVKGMLFYPLKSDWRNHPHPAEISPQHMRGWWTQANDLEVPVENSNDRWVLLPKHRWLSPAVIDPKRSGEEGLFRLDEMKEQCRKHFAEHLSPQMWAELTWDSDQQVWREANRGLVVYLGWLEAARESLAPAG